MCAIRLPVGCAQLAIIRQAGGRAASLSFLVVLIAYKYRPIVQVQIDSLFHTNTHLHSHPQNPILLNQYSPSSNVFRSIKSIKLQPTHPHIPSMAPIAISPSESQVDVHSQKNVDMERRDSTSPLQGVGGRKMPQRKRTIDMNDGNEIPQIALGVYKAPNGQETEDAIIAAVTRARWSGAPYVFGCADQKLIAFVERRLSQVSEHHAVVVLRPDVYDSAGQKWLGEPDPLYPTLKVYGEGHVVFRQDARTIAATLGMPHGEVELIIGLTAAA